MGEKEKTENSSPVNVLDLNVVQGWKRQQWRLTEHRNINSCLKTTQTLRLICVFLILINVSLLASVLVVTTATITSPSAKPETSVTVNSSIVEKQLDDLRAPPGADAYRLDLAAIYQRDGNLNKPAAHCLIDPDINLTDDLAVLTWRCESNTTFRDKNIQYIDGYLSVKVAGYYMLYSQVTYRGEGTAELDYGRIIHKMLKQKASELHESPTTLMQNLQSTPTIRRGRLAYTTSSLGATFFLETGARVSVESSIPRNIDTVESPYSTTFGLFLV